MAKRRIYLRDAYGRFRPKFGSSRRYTRRKATLSHDRTLWNEARLAAAPSRISYHDPTRVKLKFAISPNRPPSRIPKARHMRFGRT